MTEEIQKQRAELDRLLHRLGDIATMEDDCEARSRALREEKDEVRGSIASARRRIGQLEQQAQAQQQMGPRAMVEKMAKGEHVVIPPGTQIEGPVVVGAAAAGQGKKS